MTDTDSEQAWVRDARAGSSVAFTQLVRLHQQALRAFLRRLTGDRAEAEDLAQESFVLAWQKMGAFDLARAFRPWLFGIAWRRYRGQRRFWARLMARETRYAAEQPQTLEPGVETRLDLAAAFASLPPQQRAAALLCLGLEFTHAEAAETLALPLGTVKSHVTRGREKLKSLLGDET